MPADIPRLEEACRALAAGQAVVVPNPSPMTYGIVATSPEAVNALKRRPIGQNVGVSLHDAGEWRQVAPLLDVPSDVLPRVDALLNLRLTLLVGLRGSHPDWLAPAVRDGQLALFRGWWAPVARLWDGFPRLYGSSANRTGQAPAGSAPEAISNVGDAAVVIDGDALRDLSRPHGASSMVCVAPDGGLSLYRNGNQDAGLDPDAYLARLAAMDVS